VPELGPPRDDVVTFTVRVDLARATPPIWRRLELRSDLTLDQVHDILQRAMGWTDSHLHHFQTVTFGDLSVLPFLTPFDEEDEPGIEGIQEATVRLDQVLAAPGDRLFYEYDFGDSWEHVIRLEAVSPREESAPAARCVTGRRACPPEDVGGIWTYNELVAALEGRAPLDEDLAATAAWLPEDFDPADFDVDEVNEVLDEEPLVLASLNPALLDLLLSLPAPERTALESWIREADIGAALPPSEEQMAAMVAPYQALLREVGGDGLALTAAGWLPPAVVQRLWVGLGLEGTYGKGNRENLTPAVQALRESATTLGLVRVLHGRLLVTRAGARLVERPVDLWWHIVERLPLEKKAFGRLAGALRLLDVAVPDAGVMDASSALLAAAGWTTEGGRSLDKWAAYQHSHPTSGVLGTMRSAQDLWGRAAVPGGRDLARVALQSADRRLRKQPTPGP